MRFADTRDRRRTLIGLTDAGQQRLAEELPRPEAEQQTLAYMAKMPAWKNHPRVAQD